MHFFRLDYQMLLKIIFICWPFLTFFLTICPWVKELLENYCTYQLNWEEAQSFEYCVNYGSVSVWPQIFCILAMTSMTSEVLLMIPTFYLQKRLKWTKISVEGNFEWKLKHFTNPSKIGTDYMRGRCVGKQNRCCAILWLIRFMNRKDFAHNTKTKPYGEPFSKTFFRLNYPRDLHSKTPI